MPNWMDILNSATSSVVPRRAIRGLQEALSPGSSADTEGGFLDVPEALGDIAGNLTEYPLEMLGGFASGALEGARGELNPINIAGLALPGLVGAARGIGAADDIARAGASIPKYGRQAFDVVENIPPRQINPSMGDIEAIVGDARRQMARVPNATGRYRGPGAPTQAPTPEFVPRGGEAAFNAGRSPAGPMPNAAPGGRIPRVPQPTPTAPQMNRTNLPVGTLADPVGDRLAEIENALRARYNQSYPGMGRGR